MMNGVFLRRNAVTLGFGACEHPAFGPKQYKYNVMNSIIVSGHNLVYWHRAHPVCGNTTHQIQVEASIVWPLGAFESALSQSLELAGVELPVQQRLHLIDDVQIEMVQCLQIAITDSMNQPICKGLNVAEFKRSGRMDLYRSTAFEDRTTLPVKALEAQCQGLLQIMPSDPTDCQEPHKIACVTSDIVRKTCDVGR
jgi:hypothetical protein